MFAARSAKKEEGLSMPSEFLSFFVWVFLVVLVMGGLVLYGRLRSGRQVFTSAALVTGDTVALDAPPSDSGSLHRIPSWFADVMTAIAATEVAHAAKPRARVVLGEPLDLRLALTPRVSIQPSAVVWELLGEEVAPHAGSEGAPLTHTFERRQTEAPAQGEWRAGVPIELSCPIVVPRAAPPSFTTANHAIRWSAIARILVARHPDVILVQPLTVAPGGSSQGPAREGRTRQALDQGELRRRADS
jgi:hypothetical protein